MSVKNQTLAILFFLLNSSCNKNVKLTKSLSNKDSLQIENSLKALKNWCFNECYFMAEAETYKRMGRNSDCIFKMPNLTNYYYVNNSGINLSLLFEDFNRVKLIAKWVSKKEYLPFIFPPDHPDGSINIVRALDFYNSEDLKNYIDSARIVETKKYLEFMDK